MRVRHARPGMKLLLCALSVVAVGVLYAAGPPSKPIQFGGSESSGVSTNFNSLATKSDSLNPYARDAEETPRNFSNRGSMEGVMVPPVRNQQTRQNKQSKRTRELEQRRNWAIMNNEEVTNPEEEETIARLRGGAKDQKEQEHDALQLTPEERIYLSLQERKDEPRDPLRKKDDRRRDELSDDNSLTGTAREREETLRQFLGTDLNRSGPESDSPIFGTGSANRIKTPGSDFFSLGQGSLPEPNPERKARMDEFRQILGLPPVSDPMKEMFKPRTAPTFNSIRQDQPSTPAALSAFPAPAVRESTFGMVPSLTAPSSPAGQVSGLSSLTPALPQNNNARVTPPSPTFLAPKRPF